MVRMLDSRTLGSEKTSRAEFLNKMWRHIPPWMVIAKLFVPRTRGQDTESRFLDIWEPRQAGLFQIPSIRPLGSRTRNKGQWTEDWERGVRRPVYVTKFRRSVVSVR